MTPPEEGDARTFRRTFTTEEVRAFADLSGDEQLRHLEPDLGTVEGLVRKE